MRRWVGAAWLLVGCIDAAGVVAGSDEGPHVSYPRDRVEGSSRGSTDGGTASGEGGGAGAAAPAHGGDPSEEPMLGPRRPLHGQVDYDTGGGAPDITVVIAGQEFTSDADGRLEATAPVGSYQAILLDPGRYENEKLIVIWDGLTRDDPLFVVQGDYYASELGGPRVSTPVRLTGEHPDDVTFGAGFWSDTKKSSGSAWSHGSEFFTVGLRASAAEAPSGHLLGLAWSSDGAHRPTAYWYGQLPWDWTQIPGVGTVELPLAPVSARPLDVEIDVEPADKVDLTMYFSTFWPVELSDLAGPHVSDTYLFPDIDHPSADPIRMYLECWFDSDDQLGPSGAVRAPVSSSATTLVEACPAPTVLLEPSAEAPDVAAGVTLRYAAPAESCHNVFVNAGAYSIRIRTAADRVVLPDLAPLGMPWPAGAQAHWSVTSEGCVDLDQPNRPAADDNAREWYTTSGVRMFTTSTD